MVINKIRRGKSESLDCLEKIREIREWTKKIGYKIRRNYKYSSI